MCCQSYTVTGSSSLVQQLLEIWQNLCLCLLLCKQLHANQLQPCDSFPLQIVPNYAISRNDRALMYNWPDGATQCKSHNMNAKAKKWIHICPSHNTLNKVWQYLGKCTFDLPYWWRYCISTLPECVHLCYGVDSHQNKWNIIHLDREEGFCLCTLLFMCIIYFYHWLPPAVTYPDSFPAPWAFSSCVQQQQLCAYRKQ